MIGPARCRAKIHSGVFMHKRFHHILLAGVATSLLALPALAAPKRAQAAPAAPVSDPRVDQLQQQLRDLQNQLNQLKDEGDYSGRLADLKRSQNDQYVDLNNQLAAQTRASVNNGRLTLTSPDGRFSTSLRALLQYDVGYISQSKTAAAATAGGDLTSGSNFRRAQIGLNGILAGDFSYNFVYDFDYFKFLVNDRWQEVLAHDYDGRPKSGSVEALNEAFLRGSPVKVAG